MSEYIHNSAGRQETLKQLIQELHNGKSVDEVKQEFSTLLASVDISEIAALEQGLIDEGVPETEVTRLCDVHVAAFKDSLEAQSKPEILKEHPVNTFRDQNTSTAKVLDALETAISSSEWDQAQSLLRSLRLHEKHYLAKENILFPYLERHGFTGPSRVMWAIHDNIRRDWKELAQLLASHANAERITEAFKPLATEIREMFYKEENILFSTALQMLDAEEWANIGVQMAEMDDDSRAPEKKPAKIANSAQTEAPSMANGLIQLQTGALSEKQISLLLTHLPVDLTFVDGNDEVRYFSATRERIFHRSSAIIGRKVQQCHPLASVHRVQKILDDFRAGKRDVADFWIQMGSGESVGKFVFIRYFAVRDEQGQYMGTLEVSQDVTTIRSLVGERRLLDEEG